MSEDSQKVTVDKTKTGNKTKTSDKTKTGNKTKTSDKTKTGNKTKTSDKTETDNKTKTSDKTKTGGKTLTVIVGPKIAGKKRKYPKKFIVKDTDYAATLVKSSEPLTIPLSKKPKVTIHLNHSFFPYTYNLPAKQNLTLKIIHEAYLVLYDEQHNIILKDKRSWGLWALSLLIPIVGLILGFVMRSQSKFITAYWCFWAAAFGFVYGIFTMILSNL